MTSTVCQSLDGAKAGFVNSSHMRDKPLSFAPTDSMDLMTFDGGGTDEVLEGCCRRVTRAQSFDGTSLSPRGFATPQQRSNLQVFA